jgi:hypothetical protein
MSLSQNQFNAEMEVVMLVAITDWKMFWDRLNVYFTWELSVLIPGKNFILLQYFTFKVPIIF